MRLRHLPTGREIEMRPREAAIAKAILESGKALTTSHFALLLTGASSPPTNDPVLVIETMQTLQREGVVVAVDNPNAPRPPQSQP